MGRRRRRVRVSIPFIAGQWSLPPGSAEPGRRGGVFQSPSLRGSGRFHIISSQPRRTAGQVSIPFIAGQWSLRSATMRERTLRIHVSIPFIAGQWSLPGGVPPGAPDALVSIPFIAGQWSLHHRPRRRRRGDELVSIPFIAGQWSLRRGFTSRCRRRCWFQSPSLRGSGRFSGASGASGRRGIVSIPFIAGQWSLHDRLRVAMRLVQVSIPFIAGQWSLLSVQGEVRHD